MRSIKVYLLANLLAGVLITTTLATLSQVYIGYKQVRPHLDAQLAVVAYTISAFITDHNNQHHTYQQIRQNIRTYEKAIKNIDYDDSTATEDLHASIDNIQFRVYNHKNQLLVHTPSAPNIDLRKLPVNGFSKQHMDQADWRAFNLTNHKGDHIVVMQPHTTRLAIEKNNNNNAVLITLFTTPPLGLFIFIIIGRSLSSIRQTTSEISKRQRHNLNPICDKDIPVELQPLIQELNSLFDRLHHTFVRESRFAGDAAHELKTPLAALRTHAQVASQCEDIISIKKELLKVNTAVLRASKTVDQLLLLSKTMPDAYINQHNTLHLASLLRQCIAEQVPAAYKKNINISLQETQKNSNACIIGHELTLGLLFTNLIDNAVAYTYQNTDVEVVLRETNNHFFVDIIDQGPGIPNDLRTRVFERFFRVPGTDVQGTGLGLNIVQQIADLHQATVSVHTPKQHTGTQFSVRFPKPTL